MLLFCSLRSLDVLMGKHFWVHIISINALYTLYCGAVAFELIQLSLTSFQLLYVLLCLLLSWFVWPVSWCTYILLPWLPLNRLFQHVYSGLSLQYHIHLHAFFRLFMKHSQNCLPRICASQLMSQHRLWDINSLGSLLTNDSSFMACWPVLPLILNSRLLQPQEWMTGVEVTLHKSPISAYSSQCK